MGINSTEVSYGFGQMGSIFNDTGNPCKAPVGKAIVAITFLKDTTLESTGGLVAINDDANGLEFIGTAYDSSDAGSTADEAAHDIAHGSDPTALSGAGGVVVDNSNVFPKGVTIYGRWSEVHATTASAYIAYLGD